MDMSVSGLAGVKTYITHHRIIIYGMLILLIVLTYGLIIMARSQNITLTIIGTPAKPATQSTSVAPETNYANPFDKNTQYVNPFSTYKNPFDSLQP